MRYVFAEVRANSFSFTSKLFNKINLKILPKTIALVATIQFLNVLPKLKQWLKNHGKEAIIHKGGQIIGCNTTNATAVQSQVSCFLYVGSGKFHPLAIALSLKKEKPIFILNPITEEFSQLDEKEIKKVNARKKTAKIKYLGAKTLGILVSTKPGQQRLKQAEKLKAKLENQDKKAYIFIFNDFDLNQLENFPQVEAWINTACPGLSLEYPFIWIGDINFT